MACPICKKASVKTYRPFCSRRCADIDLGNWMTGAYVVPAAEPADPGEVAQELEKTGGTTTPEDRDLLH